MKTIFYIYIIFAFSAYSLFAQSYLEIFEQNKQSNFSKIATEINGYWKSLDTIPRSRGYKQFKRWEWFWEQRTYPSGEMPDINYTYSDKENKKLPNSQLNGSWSFIGPNKSIGGFAGLGRVNVIKTANSNENIMWAGAASGGLWKTTDGGSTWSTNTDNFSSLGISDIAIRPDNNVMYIATGDADAGSTFSTGVLKSTDAGESWKETSLKFKTSQLKRIYKLVMHPNNVNTLYAVGNNGVDKTTNGGQNWVNILQGVFFDFEFKPNEPETIYAVGTQFFQSTDGGKFWEQMTTGWPSINISRVAISVTPMAPNNVYAVFVNSSNGFAGFSMSTNSGSTWQIKSNTPNILGWSTTGSDAGGQGWYDLCIAASPIDPNLVYVGGINIWRTEDAGLSWILETNWYPKTGVSTVHADHHDLWFIPNNTTLFSANDGGVYRKRFNSDWQWLGSGMGITQFYSLDCSQQDSSMILAGCQDNGSKMKVNNEFTDIRGGDGMTCRIDYSDDNIIYASIPFGTILLSTDKGRNFRTVKPIGSYGAWVSPFVLNPKQPKSVIAGLQEVYKSTDMGISWNAISDFNLPEEQTLSFVAVSKSDTNVIFSGQGSGILKKTINGGSTWTDFTRPADLWITYLAINPNNSNDICVSLSGYLDANKIFRSSDGGQTWTNITGSLPNVPFNTVAFEENTPNRIYAGCDIGVYYIDDTKNDWIHFSDGLPNVVVTEFAFQYNSRMLRAATYGRGIWETNLAPTELTASITGDTNVCTSAEKTYFTSSFPGVVNNWSAFGGNIVSQSNKDTVKVIWNTAGKGSIKLVQSLDADAIKDSSIKTITITNLPNAEIQGPDSVCNNANMIYSSTNIAPSIRWQVQGGAILGSDTSKNVNVYWSSDSSASLQLILSSSNSQCSDTTSKQINLRRIQKPDIIGNQTVCENEESDYSSDFAKELIPFWSVVGGSIISNNGSNIRVKWRNETVSKVILKLSDQNNGCTDSTHYNVAVMPVPIADIIGSLQTCLKTETVYSTSSDSNYIYKWKVTNGYILGPDTMSSASVVWTNPGSNTLELTKKLNSGDCFADSLITVVCMPNPVPNITGLSEICMNEQTEYASTSVSGNGIEWEVSGGEILGSATDSIVSILWTDYGIGNVKLRQTNPSTNCTDSSVFAVEIYQLPNSNFLGMTSVCPNCTEEYTAIQSGLTNKWTIEGGELLTQNNTDTISVKWSGSGTGTIKLIQTTTDGSCTDSTEKNIEITSDLSSSIAGDTLCCLNEYYLYSTTSSSDFSNTWSVDSGEIIGDNTRHSINVKWTNQADAKVHLQQTNIATQEKHAYELSVNVKERPEKPEITSFGYALQSSSETGNQWYFNNDRIAGENDNIIYPAFEGIYKVIVIDANGCVSEFSEPFEYLFNSIIGFESNEISIFPNPATNELFVRTKRTFSDNVKFSIQNIFGYDCNLEVEQQSSDLFRINMDCSGGHYILKMTSEREIFIQQFIIVK